MSRKARRRRGAEPPSDSPSAQESTADARAALERLVAALDDAEAALRACGAPLYLEQSRGFLSRFGAGVRTLAGELVEVESIVEGDLPVAARLPGKNRTWFFRKGSEMDALSPRQLVAARRALLDEPSMESVSYLSVLRGAAVVSGGRDVPWVRSAASEAAAALRLEILADVESRPCPRCDVPAGFVCRSVSEKVAGPHAARRELSPVAAEHPVSKSLKRWDFEAAEIEGTKS